MKRNLLLFICGTALTWSSPELPKLIDPATTRFHRKISPDETSWISSILTLGAAIGPFIFGYLAEKIGRKATLLYLGVPFLVCYPFLAFSKTTEAFFVARFIMGLAVGGTFLVMPMYIGEIADKHNRGALGSSMSCFVCFGIFFSCSLGPYISVTAFNLILAAFPLVYLALFFPIAPESPYFYISGGETDLAKGVLEKMYASPDIVEKELIDIQTTIAEEAKATFKEIIGSKGLTKALTISVGLLVFQQFSGINAVLFYSQQIFQQTGTTLPAEICTIIIVGVQFLSSFLTPLIVERFGKKKILIFSAVGMAASEVPLGVFCYLKNHGVDVTPVTFLPILTLTTFIISFNSGFGPLPWALLCELFPSNVKSIASASVSSIIWVLAFFITKYFEAMVVMFGVGQLFLFFAFCCMLSIMFVIFCVIETKGKTLNEIQDLLMNK
ncbi:hypothetical protein NQ314_000798 [Rhamnusium bicolor]|uniref:Major facilitator superfamily (MFS) profile domain-containing protein n=1 Tax=Rhamnusium bicolor TaxID=1586634 RepID=A0AAV8ZW42_9CUCU|nr:hypothetical protein NQ314_000798 [Rhamnusium bicolor]